MPKLKYFAPNTVTAISLLLGLGSVVMAARGELELAAWMILWCTLLDKLDGTVARLFKATSEFGVQFDSFADFVAFGIAPAALIYCALSATGSYHGWHDLALMGAGGIYVLALALRLARFNITTSANDTLFSGIPGTLLGGIIASGYLTFSKHQLNPVILAYAPAYLLIGAGLMVSGLRLPKMRRRKSKLFNLFQFSNIAGAYICGPLMIFPEYLFALGSSYLVFGVGWCLVRPAPPVQEDEEARRSLAT